MKAVVLFCSAYHTTTTTTTTTAARLRSYGTAVTLNRLHQIEAQQNNIAIKMPDDCDKAWSGT